MINWFEWHKHAAEVNADIDWRASGSPVIGEAFRQELPTWLRYGKDVATCR